MSNSRSLIAATERQPTEQEIALRPELVKQMLNTVSQYVNEHDIEHAVVVGITTDGNPRLYHSYGKDLALGDVAQLLEDIAALARKQLTEQQETKQ